MKRVAAIEDYPPIKGSFRVFHSKLGGIPLDRILMRPPPGTATEADLLASWCGPGQHCCELIDGTLIVKYASLHSSILVGALTGHIGRYLDRTDLGVALMGKVPFRLRPGLIRLPSFTFTPWENLSGEELPDEQIATFIPGLTVDMLSMWGTPAEFERKVAEYFEAGVRRAWVIDVRSKSAKIYTSPKRFKELDETGTLDGGKVLPGFKLTLTDLFAATKRRKKKPR